MKAIKSIEIDRVDAELRVGLNQYLIMNHTAVRPKDKIRIKFTNANHQSVNSLKKSRIVITR